MSNEKMKYMQHYQDTFPLMDYEEQLLKVLNEQPDGSAWSLLMEILAHDRAIRYQLLARYIPLNLDKMLHLLQSFIQEQKQGEDTIPEAGENELQRLTDALTERGKELLDAGEFLEAADTGFAILLAMEPELPNVYDEGISYQAIVDETFGFLRTIAKEKYGPETKALLQARTATLYSERKEADRYYDDEWLGLIKLFC